MESPVKDETALMPGMPEREDRLPHNRDYGLVPAVITAVMGSAKPSFVPKRLGEARIADRIASAASAACARRSADMRTDPLRKA